MIDINILKSSKDYEIYLKFRGDLLHVRDALRRLASDFEDEMSDDLLEAITDTRYELDKIGLCAAINYSGRIKLKFEDLLAIFRKSLCLDSPCDFPAKYQAFSKTGIVLKSPGSIELITFTNFEMLSYGSCSMEGISVSNLEIIRKSRLVKKLYGECFLDGVYVAMKSFSSKVVGDAGYIFFGSDHILIRHFFNIDCGYKDFLIKITDTIDGAIEVSEAGDY